MREILFRGKRVDNGEWVEGYLGVEVGGEPVIEYCDFDDYIGDCVEELFIIPETVGQYTGLTDKNGRRIFEGDILSGHLDELFPNEESRYPVVWHDYGWHIKCGNESFDTLEQSWVNKYLEVIGNIHDNPELLNGEREREVHNG